MSTYIDINCDMGESYGRWTLGQDEEVMPHITSANVACGFHGGDPHVMRRTVALAQQYGVAVGAHPGLPDLMGFGRRRMEVTADELKDYHRYQIGALDAFCRAAGTRLQHVKPHGIQYHMFEENLPLGRATAEQVLRARPRPHPDDHGPDQVRSRGAERGRGAGGRRRASPTGSTPTTASS